MTFRQLIPDSGHSVGFGRVIVLSKILPLVTLQLRHLGSLAAPLATFRGHMRSEPFHALL